MELCSLNFELEFKLLRVSGLGRQDMGLLSTSLSLCSIFYGSGFRAQLFGLPMDFIIRRADYPWTLQSWLMVDHNDSPEPAVHSGEAAS